MADESDAAIIAASLGDPERFGLLFDRHATAMFRYFVRRVGADEADSLLGELFRVAFERRATYDCSHEQARPWLYGIATRLLARHHRSEARRLRATARLVGSIEHGQDTSERTVESIDAGVRWPVVAEVLAGLPEAERDALLLYAWEDLSYQEIATALGVPVGTVRSRLNRARRRLRELLPVQGETTR
jgi:RNA polymerase sigma factor (sigma-70 family)